MKKKYWIGLFILVIVVILGLVFSYKILGLGGPSYKCEKTFADGKVVLFFYNINIVNQAEDILKENNLTYKEPYYFDSSNYASISIDVPVGEEDNYLQKIKKEMIDKGLLPDDFTLERDILICLY